MTQNDTVLALLRTHPEGITAMDVLKAGGGMRAAARVSDLKEAGHRIESERVEGGTWVRYILREREEQAALPW